jgi:hypothetical protein
VKAALGLVDSPRGMRIVRHHHGVRLSDIPSKDKYFFFVRDPLERLISGFIHRQNQGLPRYDRPWSPVERDAFAKFDNVACLADAFAAGDPAAERALISIRHVHTSYWDWFPGGAEELLASADRLLLIGRQERLESDFAALRELLDLPAVDLPRDPVIANKNTRAPAPPLSAEGRSALQAWLVRDYAFLRLCEDELGLAPLA